MSKIWLVAVALCVLSCAKSPVEITPQQEKKVEDNVSIIMLLILLGFEVICFVVSKFLDNK